MNVNKKILHYFQSHGLMLCKDITGKPHEASLVFENSIRNLRRCFDQQIPKSCGDHNIEYVLTVPAVWGERAKMFMREAAVKVSKCF